MKYILLTVFTLATLSTNALAKECTIRDVGAACHALKIIQDACLPFFRKAEKQWVQKDCSQPDVAEQIKQAERDMGDLADQIRTIVSVLVTRPAAKRTGFCDLHLNAARRNYKIPVVVGEKTCSP